MCNYLLKIQIRCVIFMLENIKSLGNLTQVELFQLKVAYDSSVIRSPGTPIRGHTPLRQAD